MENGEVTISRSPAQYTFPCRFTLVAAMNPCPCGYFGHPFQKCSCTPKQVSAYLGKISAPLLDRIDLHVELMPVRTNSCPPIGRKKSSKDIRLRVAAARQRQLERFQGSGLVCNAQIPPAMLSQLCHLSPEADRLFERVFNKLGLSGRAYDRILKVARTIADLDGSQAIPGASPVGSGPVPGIGPQILAALRLKRPFSQRQRAALFTLLQPISSWAIFPTPEGCSPSQGF